MSNTAASDLRNGRDLAPATDFQKDELLALLFHTMSQETRRRVMLELPQAYNAYVQRDVVKVSYCERGQGDVT